MAHHTEPMDVDCMDSEFDNKENTFHHNVPCTEKGYEELDVSELNMKLRYSMTPASSPMSKSYTACPDNSYENGDALIGSGENANLTRSLSSTMTKNDNIIKSLKSLPLQSLRSEHFTDGNGNASVLRQLDSTAEDTNIMVTISGTNDTDENVSLPSSSSSVLHTPEATTPTKDTRDDASPIMRGLKSVLNMFRSSTSPIPPSEDDNITVKHEPVSSPENVTINEDVQLKAVASTPIAAHRSKDSITPKRTSPHKDSVVFKDDLEKELNWKDEKTCMPIHKLLLHNSKTLPESKTTEADLNSSNTENNFHSLEYMNVSNNESILQDKTMTDCYTDNHEPSITAESDSEFVDCETTFSKNESYVLDVRAIQEKISPKVNHDETKQISCTTKTTEFVHCDSTFSNNESYVLDVKEIQDKISAIPNLDETTVHIASTSQSAAMVNQTFVPDDTNMSFGNLDFKLDTTLPSDYSDYSQATTEILNELEKLEENEFDVNRQACKLKDIAERNYIPEQQVDTPEHATNVVTQNENNPEQENESTESQENQINVTENNCSELETTLRVEQNVDITQAIAPKIIDVPDHVLNNVQCNESLNSSELETTLTVEKNVDITQSVMPKIIDVPDTVVNNGQCNEPFMESEGMNSQSQEVRPIQDYSKDRYEVKVGNTLHIANADQSLESTTIHDSKNSEKESVNEFEIISQEFNESPIAVSNIFVEKVPSEISNGMQNHVKSVDILNVVSNDVISLEVVSNSHDAVPSEASSIIQNDVFPESSAIPPGDILLPEEVIDFIKTLDFTETLTEVQKTENPFDIPLPDDDDVDKETAISEGLITSVDATHTLPSDTIMVLSELNVSLIPEKKVGKVENKISEDFMLTSETSRAPLSELQTSSDVKTLKTLYEKEINSTEVSSELNSLCLKTGPHMSADHLSSTTTNLDSTTAEIVSENTPNNSSESKINHNNTLIEAIPSSDVVFNHTNDNIAGNVMMHDLNNKDTVIIDDLGHDQNTSQIEPMDITMNESLNLTNELPDLVNQTIVLAEKNVQNPIVNDTNNEDKVEVIPNIPDIDNYETLKTSSNVSTEKIECGSDSKDGFNTVLVETISGNETSVIPEQNIVTDLPINYGKQPACGAENVDNMPMKLSDDQPPKVFTNTSESEAMEVDETTVDEEIIASANNSPYVSLMSGIEVVQEKNYNPEKIEDAFEKIENPFVTKTGVASSPPISSKGYNFNFDDIDDPFATKTKIRLSPPLDTPTNAIETANNNDKQFKVPNKGGANRRRSQPPERKKPALKKKFNNSFDVKSAPILSTNQLDNIVMKEDLQNKINACETLERKQVLEKATNEANETFDTTQTQKENLYRNKAEQERKKEEIQTELKEVNVLEIRADNKSSIDSFSICSDLKITSSSEQSTYYSAGGSSTESFKSKNVFNLPEIDDANFNPFATKSKMRQSPPPDTEIDNPFATRSKMRQSPPPNTAIDNPFATKSKMIRSPDVSVNSHSQLDKNRTLTLDESKLAQLANNIENEDKMETELMEKDTSANITDTTSSSRATDNQNLTTREVNTEDEDTIEGPFLDLADDIEQNTDFSVDNDDMMHFNELQETAQANEDNDGELFIDAEAFEFLLNQNKSNVVADSGKESLFLKFDPLFAKRISSDGVLATIHKAQKKQSTPTKPTRPSLRNEASPIAGPSNLYLTYEGDNNISQESNEDANITVTKPMMVVTPALNPAVTPRNKSITPARSNRRSITFTSPAIAVIDRLLSMSANNSALGHNATITRAQSNDEQTEAELALTQLRELLAEKEISVYNLRSESKELKDRLSTMESQVRILEADGQDRLRKISELNERLTEKTKINKSMAAVVEEYERTIASLIADIEQDKKRNAEEKVRLINERDEQTAHLASMEVSFSDLHSKYEKSKHVILTCKANEDIFKKTIQDFEEQVTKMQTNYEMLKQHATAKLNHANQELEKINRAHEAEVLKLNAMIKRNHLLATSLQETLAQKTKANDELTAICDELINKVGSNK